MMLAIETRNALLAFSTETIGEVCPEARLFQGGIQYRGGGKICGMAFPVKLEPGDNLGAHQAIYEARAGEILVIGTNACTSFGFWGEIMTVAALARGVVGVVTDGAVRDLDTYDRLRFPMFSGGVHVRGTGKKHNALFPLAVALDGVEIAVGDVVVGDETGIAAFSSSLASEIIHAAKKRVEKEADILERLRKGETTLQIYSLPPTWRNVR